MCDVRLLKDKKQQSPPPQPPSSSSDYSCGRHVARRSRLCEQKKTALALSQNYLSLHFLFAAAAVSFAVNSS